VWPLVFPVTSGRTFRTNIVVRHLRLSNGKRGRAKLFSRFFDGYRGAKFGTSIARELPGFEQTTARVVCGRVDAADGRLAHAMRKESIPLAIYNASVLLLSYRRVIVERVFIEQTTRSLPILWPSFLLRNSRRFPSAPPPRRSNTVPDGYARWRRRAVSVKLPDIFPPVVVSDLHRPRAKCHCGVIRRPVVRRGPFVVSFWKPRPDRTRYFPISIFRPRSYQSFRVFRRTR